MFTRATQRTLRLCRPFAFVHPRARRDSFAIGQDYERMIAFNARFGLGSEG